MKLPTTFLDIEKNYTSITPYTAKSFVYSPHLEILSHIAPQIGYKKSYSPMGVYTKIYSTLVQERFHFRRNDVGYGVIPHDRLYRRNRYPLLTWIVAPLPPSASVNPWLIQRNQVPIAHRPESPIYARPVSPETNPVPSSPAHHQYRPTYDIDLSA